MWNLKCDADEPLCETETESWTWRQTGDCQGGGAGWGDGVEFMPFFLDVLSWDRGQGRCLLIFFLSFF